jgi:hypothetical protein
MALTLFQCMKNFFDLTEPLSGTSYPTANLFCKGFCEIRSFLINGLLVNIILLEIWSLQ